ncbi:MAG: polysaccharide pyruvyl transferase family protein [Oscillospiraceae bacterium]
MKYGVLMHKNTQNIGDDIQTFSAANLLPSIDYFVNRETFDTFKTDHNEPVAVVMSAWYMWHKWNFPPSRQIVPLYVGMHYSDHAIANQDGSPIKTEFLTGLGGEYLNANGPVGCRDMFTLNNFKDIGINAYFSGCITLALPKMPVVKSEKEYICVVDIDANLVQKTRERLEGTGIEVREIAHRCDYRDSDASWEERQKAVTDLLTIYQNAKCVVTRRLHCALPCLAMGVPVAVINRKIPDSLMRFEPYDQWLHVYTKEEYLSDAFDYDVSNPPANNGGHIPTREKLIASVLEFVEKYKDENDNYKKYDKFKRTDDEVIKWRHDTMKSAMDLWFNQTRKDFHSIKTLKADVAKLRKNLNPNAKKQEVEIAALKKQISDLTAANDEMTLRNRKYEKVLKSSPASAYVKVRNLFVAKDKKIKLDK